MECSYFRIKRVAAVVGALLLNPESAFAQDGLYALVQHPQYSGLFIGLFGEGVEHEPRDYGSGVTLDVLYLPEEANALKAEAE